MLTVRMSMAGLARVRFAASQACESIAWLALAADGGTHPLYGDPGAAARFALRDPAVRLLAHAMPPGHLHAIPDFLTPQPTGELDDQIDRIRATPADTARAQVLSEWHAPPLPVLRALDDGTFARRAADALHRFWTVAMRDEWASLLPAIEADVGARLSTAGARGLGAMLDGLHPSIGWAGSELQVAKKWDAVIDVGDEGLVLAPSVVGWDSVWAQWGKPDETFFTFPVRVPAHRPPPHPPRLAPLIGESRAALLAQLDTPLTTTQLSHRHGLAASTVSYHLAVLQRAGLVTRRRRGGAVEYSRTEQGHALAFDRPRKALQQASYPA